MNSVARKAIAMTGRLAAKTGRRASARPRRMPSKTAGGRFAVEPGLKAAPSLLI